MERLLHRGYGLDKKEASIQTDHVTWVNYLQKDHFNSSITSWSMQQTDSNFHNLQKKFQRKVAEGNNSNSAYSMVGNPSIVNVINNNSRVKTAC
mmetsp:Transcript_21091/g.20253  ORF Transcript_21091/g.20253 Transcript_21091/m.20253 type:complete len:94 (+) Transcript_21091:350-631(+)